MSIPFFGFPSSTILIIGAFGIELEITVIFIDYQKYLNSPFYTDVSKKALIKEQKE